MIFWIFAVLIAAVTAVALVVALIRGRDGAEPAASYDLKVYRDQLKEVEKDKARGVISAEDAERARLEISRRVLEADRKLQAQAGKTGGAPKAASLAAASVAGAVVLAGSMMLYTKIGAPGYPDMPLEARKAKAEELRESRPRQAEAEAEVPPSPSATPDPRHLELVERLRQVVEERPGDIQGLTLLARNEAALGNFKAAYIAQSKLIAAKGDAADTDDFATMADMMVLAANGYVSPEAEAAVMQALNLDSTNGTARYYLGLMYIQTGRPDLAFRVWRSLHDDSTMDDPWMGTIRSALEDLSIAAGIDYRLPPAPAGVAGPSMADIEAAGDMTPEERQAMIRGMVERLMNRMASQGGTPAEWAQLIQGLSVIGETERAAAIWNEAKRVFADRPEAYATVEAAAREAGLTDGSAPAPALTAPPRGPTAEDVKAAQDMTPEERQDMIRTMVEQLNDRLMDEGGTPAEWARLIQVLTTLGETERAASVWETAQGIFADAPADLAVVQAAAMRAGVAE